MKGLLNIHLMASGYYAKRLAWMLQDLKWQYFAVKSLNSKGIAMITGSTW